jgi:hypothetical protein
MSKRLLSFAGSLALAFAVSASALAQDTQTQTQTTVTTTTTQAVQHADGTWTVIEYPVNKEVFVDFAPSANFTGAKGRAKVMRMGDHTMVNLDLSGLTNAGNFNLYAVDPMGKVSLLGPVTVNNGTATQTFTTPLNRFMLVLSPEGNLTTITPQTPVAFRSVVPQGFAVVPTMSTGDRDGAAVGERVSAVTTPGTTSTYSAPMLGIPGFRRGEDTQMKINFSGAMTGARANVNIEPRKDGPTTIKMRFHELKEAPAGHTYVVWAVSPDGKYHRLGQIVNTGTRNEAQIQSETALQDFGLLVTLESEPGMPTGTVIGTVIR